MTNPDSRADSPADFPTHYDGAATERVLYAEWEAAGVFRADPARSRRTGGDREPYTIVIPPPNVTGVLHMGHGLNNTAQDVLIRWRRMSGDEALWVPGTDHAGIATQNVVEKQLAREGSSRETLGRDAFVARVTEHVERTGGVILEQLRAIGASCDWRRTAYTLSPELSRAVREVFVRLYDDGLIYRGHRVIHWCPRCLTALSDEEAEFHDETGALYHVAYPVAGDETRRVVVATTRPETLPGDVAVAVHPDDERYADLIGRQLVHPLNGLRIPVIADTYVDRAFGTGALKITPAHDANDFDVGARHGLPAPVILTPDAFLRDDPAPEGARTPAEFVGMDRETGRKAIVKRLDSRGYLVKREQHQHAVRHCYRCDTVVEPRLSDQWFVKMAPLAAPALQAVRDGTIRVLPERWEAVYVNWMEGIRDWNISRQIWWGHRVPVWHCESCGFEKAYRDDPARCERCGGAVAQETDVLDTWFSSWLWPFSTLGWPAGDPADLRAFYPTDALVTAPEILFFWVARMIMAGYYCVGSAPFHTVYLTGTVRDMQHRKMSKSLGNGIDPLDVVGTFGADALRYTLLQGMGLGVDVMLDPTDLEKSFAPGRNFATKLWNIGRFLLLSVGEAPVRAFAGIPDSQLTRADRWILDRLNRTIAECDAALGPARPPTGDRAGAEPGWPIDQRNAGMRLDAYVEAARRFVWNELADWYVEHSKTRLQSDHPDREIARSVLVHVFDQALRLMHPAMPFLTESLWRRLPTYVQGTFLATSAWPATFALPADADAFEVVREVVDAIRRLRAEYSVPVGEQLAAHVVSASAARRSVLEQEDAFITRIARCKLSAEPAPAGAAAHAVLPNGVELVLPLAGLVDLDKEVAKLRGELEALDKQLTALRGRLANEQFTAKAPPELVNAERAKERDWTARRHQLDVKVRSLCGE